jgi:hypothetical protein
MAGRSWSKEELLVLFNHYQSVSVEEISKLLPNRTRSSIHSKASRLGLECGVQCPRHVEVDLDFFEIPDMLNSYWAGFIAADGNVYFGDGNRCEFSVELSKKDEKHLERFSEDLSYKGSIKLGKKDCVKLSVTGAHKIAKDLKSNFGIVPTKNLYTETSN